MFYLHVSLFVFSFQLVRLLSLYLDCQWNLLVHILPIWAACGTTGPLYLSCVSNPSSQVWYKGQPMGENKINGMMKSVIEGTSLEDSSKTYISMKCRWSAGQVSVRCWSSISWVSVMCRWQVGLLPIVSTDIHHGRYVGRYSVNISTDSRYSDDMSTEYPSTYRPIYRSTPL